ncbi:MAG: hypothetical protein ACOCV2_14555 [Persicimonas sp.]
MSERTHTYSTICWILAICFAVVLAGLAFTPDLLATVMEEAGGLVGLRGDIAVGAGSLAHALALSLMATITYLAVAGAKNPESLVAYRALMTAKIMSTFVFLFLTVTAASIWLLPTITDASVIVVLVLARGSLPDSDRATA